MAAVTMTGPPRHLLVIAPQCQAMSPLRHLKEAACALERVLTDETIGACVPALSGDDALLYGPVSNHEIRDRVADAVDRAATEDATLVLALLGHGWVPGDATKLYLMGHDAQEGGSRRGVDVGGLLSEAVDTLGVGGVLAIVDTCFAGNAIPSVDELIRGQREGQVQLALLMASSATEPALDLRFSRELADVLSRGVLDAGPRLHVTDVVDELRLRLPGQTVNILDFDASSAAGSRLWVARNTRHDSEMIEDLIGPKGRQRLRAAQRIIDPRSLAAAGPWDNYALQNLREQLDHHVRTTQSAQALRAVLNARIARATVRFLRSRIRRRLSTDLLRGALTALWADEEWPPMIPRRLTDVEAVDHVAFGHPETHDDCREWMGKFVWLVASQAGVPADDEELWRWAEAVGALQKLTDAIAAVRKMREREQLRLVIRVPSLAGDWPESLEWWLYWEDKTIEHDFFVCDPVGKAGTELALNEVLGLAYEAAATLPARLPQDATEAGPAGPFRPARLTRVDVALPSALLLTWHPERVRVGPHRLGGEHDVLTHWGQRLNPSRMQLIIDGAAETRLENIDSCETGVPLDWIAESRCRERGTLQADLESDRYTGAVGLEYHPGTDTALMDLLLQYIPILLWPRAGARFPAERQGRVDRHWEHLPGRLLSAYRKQWRNGEGEDLADLRAVWDNQDWLDFCRKFRHSAVS